MQQIQYRIAAIICTLACLLGTADAPAKSTYLASKATERAQRRQRQENAAVIAWFKEYGQIRRNAEMTKRDRYQALYLGENQRDKNNAALASRMIERYATAEAAMKQLPSIPETNALHEGYIQYFSSARQLFADFLEAQKEVPFTTKALVPAKKRLAALDKTNKRIDAQLRKKYKIPKHRHS